MAHVVDTPEDTRDAGDARWKSRYLGALDAHERLERDAGTRVGELGALIARLPRAMPGAGSGALAKQLSSLADALRSNPLSPRISSSLREAQARILDAMDAQERERAVLMGALDQAAGQLEPLCAGRDFRRRLKRFRAGLSRRHLQPASELVVDLAQLQKLALEAPAGTQATTALPRAGTRVPPAAQAAAVDRSAVRQVLTSLVARVELPDGFRDELAQVTASLEEEPSEARLLKVLERVRDLFDAALSSMRGEFREFLDSVDRRADTLLAVLGQVRADGRAASDLERGLADSVQASIAAMRGEAAAAMELDQLKSVIDGHLECLVHSVQEFRGQGDSLAAGRDARLEAMARRLRELESESREARGQLETQRRLALTDALTGLPNRNALEQRLAAEMASSRRLGTPLAVAMADIDHFKRINDACGQQAGDRALGLVANIMGRRIRQSDFCARVGGEEFALLFPGTDAAAAQRVVEQVRVFVAGCGFSYKGQPVPLTASFGVTELLSGDDAASVLERADAALYAAKKAGRNAVRRS